MADIEVRFHRLAEKEFYLARERYKQVRVELGESFELEVDRAIERIVDDPAQWPKLGRIYRWVKTRRFPYFLYYRILDDTHVFVVAVAHGRRRTRYWQSRRP